MAVVSDRRASGPRASFVQRLAAALLDGVVLLTAFVVLTQLLKSVGYVTALLIAVAYFTVCEGGPTGQTIGKRLLGIRVVDFDTGARIGYVRGLFRYLGRAVSSFVLYVGYLWMLWDREAQTWHDKFVNTVVVPISAYPIGYHHVDDHATAGVRS
jgi:uncharacterized RDD family membrane protein YckC